MAKRKFGSIVIVLFLANLQWNSASPVFREQTTKWKAQPDYSRCHMHASCNPSDLHPCGCPHACCAPDTGETYRADLHNHAVPFMYGYRCYRKPKAGEACFDDFHCPCQSGLLCLKKLSERNQRYCRLGR
eukprot:Seg1208.3 transcript_id=Seg1208.3/GoldUCD/mRNA.D3Y31 product="hypothetical protein" protein_id=Seg1208.3/GoldUCD/D3Y31